MRYYHLCILFLILGCKTNKPVSVSQPEEQVIECILSKLPKTTGYENRMESYTSIYKDTVFEIESMKNGMVEYTAKIELQASKRYLWLLKENEKGIDTLLIHCITPLKSVDSDFIMKDCSLEIEVTEYDNVGNPVVSRTNTIKL